MTFMNTRVDFWCGCPEHLLHLEQDDWKVLSGQRSAAAEQEGDADAGGEAGAAGSCRVLDHDYQAHSEEGLKCGRDRERQTETERERTAPLATTLDSPANPSLDPSPTSKNPHLVPPPTPPHVTISSYLSIHVQNFL